jgi:hypothetical protein
MARKKQSGVTLSGAKGSAVHALSCRITAGFMVAARAAADRFCRLLKTGPRQPPSSSFCLLWLSRRRCGAAGLLTAAFSRGRDTV